MKFSIIFLLASIFLISCRTPGYQNPIVTLESDRRISHGSLIGLWSIEDNQSADEEIAIFVIDSFDGIGNVIILQDWDFDKPIILNFLMTDYKESRYINLVNPLYAIKHEGLEKGRVINQYYVLKILKQDGDHLEIATIDMDKYINSLAEPGESSLSYERNELKSLIIGDSTEVLEHLHTHPDLFENEENYITLKRHSSE